MTAWYNEIDPYCVQWLRNLIAEGLIAPGVVDDRPIQDVRSYELAGFTQCHFFAGLGGWSHALRLASWPDHRAVWTGSCPCQPFSTAGARRGFADDRHLWPWWRYLIAVCRPAVVFGEQVARAAEWQRLVHGDLEALGYAVGAACMEAASVGAPHLRDRFWFVAQREPLATGEGTFALADGQGQHAQPVDAEVARAPQPAADPFGGQLRQQSGRSGGTNGAGAVFAGEHGVAGASSHTDNSSRGREAWHAYVRASGKAIFAGEEEFRRRCALAADTNGARSSFGRQSQLLGQQLPAVGGYWRETEPPVCTVDDGLPGRVAQMRALGNAIVPQAAAEFIRASGLTPSS